MNIVSTNWLKTHLGDPKLLILDGSLKLTNAQRQIPGSKYFDLEHRLSDLSSDLPHMMPSPEVFTIEVRRLGVNQDSMVVVYDRTGVYSSPRVWWMFKAMGFNNVAVLDGGLPAWIDDGGETEHLQENLFTGGDFIAQFQPKLISNIIQVNEALKQEKFLVFDARSEKRFNGLEAEPRLGLKTGHMPHSLNLPFTNVLNSQKLKNQDELKNLFSNVIPEQHLIFSCGSGVTACIVLLAAHIAGLKNLSLYDGSWTEWGQL